MHWVHKGIRKSGVVFLSESVCKDPEGPCLFQGLFSASRHVCVFTGPERDEESEQIRFLAQDVVSCLWAA